MAVVPTPLTLALACVGRAGLAARRAAGCAYAVCPRCLGPPGPLPVRDHPRARGSYVLAFRRLKNRIGQYGSGQEGMGDPVLLNIPVTS